MQTAPDIAESADSLSRHLDLVAEMGQAFAHSLDLAATIRLGLGRIAENLDAEAASLFLLEEEELVARACVGPVDITGLRLPASQGIVGRTLRDGATQHIRDVAADPDFTRKVDDRTGFSTRSILSAPMMVRDQKIGVIQLINRRSGDHLFDSGAARLLEALAAAAALAILNTRQASALLDQQRLRQELELAAEIQRGLLPEAEASSPVQAMNIAAYAVSGDFYDFFTLPDGRIAFNLADVSGKGMNAALLMAKTSSLYRCLGKTIFDPAEVLVRVNAELVETASHGMFVTMVGGLYNPETGRLLLANAGHEPALIHRGGDDFLSIGAESPPLGVVPLEPGDLPVSDIDLSGAALYLFTDGLTEGYLEGGGEFGVEGVRAAIADGAALPPPDRIRAIVEAVARPGAKLRDDVTLLMVAGRDD